MPEESLAIGLSRPLSGMQALSVIFPGTVLAGFAMGAFGGVLSSLGGRNLTEAIVAGLLTVAFSALLARFLYDFLPQRAWLRGSVLAVERRGRQRQCDLATAEVVKLGRTVWPMTRGYSDAVPVLCARQRKGSALVRLTLRGDDLRIAPAAQLVLLAEAIESRPESTARAANACARLRRLADKQAPLPVLDWSFRTGPHRTRTDK